MQRINVDMGSNRKNPGEDLKYQLRPKSTPGMKRSYFKKKKKEKSAMYFKGKSQRSHPMLCLVILKTPS